MKRAHRRMHVLLWLLLAPLTLAGLALALKSRPAALVTEIPAPVAEEAP